MKNISIILGLLLTIACGGGEKKVKETTPPPSQTYSYMAPTQEMLDSGKVAFYKSCYICHENAVGDVTMLSNKTQLDKLDDKYLEKLLQHVRDGYTGNYGTMPPKGSCMECSEEELRNAILYMLKNSSLLD